MRRFVIAIILIVLPMTAISQDTDQRPSLQALFGDRTLSLLEPGSVMWLPDGEHLIYTLESDDGEDLWRESVASGERTIVTSWSSMLDELRAQRPDWHQPVVSDPNASSRKRWASTLSPDGNLLVGCVAGDLFSLHIPSATARFLTDDAEDEIFPTFSPDGQKVAFVREGDLFWLDVNNGSPHQLTDRGEVQTVLHGVADWVYEEEFDVNRAFWWSPDSSRIAFLQFDVSPVPLVPILNSSGLYPTVEQQRYPKAGAPNPLVQVGVIELENDTTRWILAGEQDWYLPRAGWTPAGEVWVQRLNRDQNELQLVVVAPATGALRMLVLETDAAWINIADHLTFLADGRFLWTSEKDGWRHLYLHRSDGRLIRKLSSGDFQIDEVYGLDAAQSQVWVRSSRSDRRQRHIEVIDLQTAEIRRLDRDSGGVHDGLLSPLGTHLVDTWSSLDTPPRADLLAIAEGPVRELWRTDEQLADWNLLPFEPGTVSSADGTELDSLLLRPRDFDAGQRYPAVLYMYGGPHSQLTRDEWGGSIHHTWRCFAEQGMAVFVVDNRGTDGRGRGFERAVHRQLGQLEVADQLAAAKWLKAQPWVDGDRIAAYGGSYGGYLVLMCVLTAPEEFRAGIAYAPVADWRFYDSIYTERYMDLPADNTEGYRLAAPLELAENLETPVLLVHGIMDNNVHVQNTLQLIDKFAAAEKPFELMLYPQTRHGVRRSSFAPHFHELKMDFLLRHLMEE